jgi:hypothetical protein
VWCGRPGKRCRTLENGGMTSLRMFLYVVAVGPVLGYRLAPILTIPSSGLLGVA